ncbi:MAG: 50S ribosomal protein L17 [Candidatus Poribacteria bacterium]|nr:50S ribosomal protein L17 [Candidatus Poribacteria bacterium]MDE0503906.1 50S ribosomal protein L17 [Candidatus Poribacteria bacterium]
MRHRKAGRKLGRTSSHRRALFRNQATALFEHEQIRTTVAKSKELRRIAERLITLAKRGDLHARRQAARMIIGTNLHEKDGQGKHSILQKLFDEIGPRYQDRNGGYTRIIRGELRRGDGAQMAYIQLV